MIKDSHGTPRTWTKELDTSSQGSSGTVTFVAKANTGSHDARCAEVIGGSKRILLRDLPTSVVLQFNASGMNLCTGNNRFIIKEEGYHWHKV